MTWLNDFLLRLGYVPITKPVETLTIGEALLANDPGNEIVENQRWADLRFVPTKNYLDVMYGNNEWRYFNIRTNAGWRWLGQYPYKDGIYIFVPGHKETAGVVEKTLDGTAWHGRAFGRLI